MVGKNSAQLKLIAEFLTNIGVAWFGVGVIGVFAGGAKSVVNILISLSWGTFFSVLFLWIGISFLKGVRQ
ncbi:MAG: hypothetical protein Q8P91_00935 [bacterium]|nr:hypothetical protein [bacterium]